MLWDCLLLFSAFWMNGLSTEFIDSCARGLGSKRLRLSLPWEDSSVEHVISDKKESIIRPPTWVEFPLQLFDHADAVSRPARLDRYNAKVHLSEVSWVASEDRKLNDALQCWRVIVLDSTSNTELGNLLMQCIELGKGDDYVWQVVKDAFANKSTATLKSRAASLLAFGRWKKTAMINEPGGIFPITEMMAYEYLCDLRRMKAAPSKGKRFLESVGFSKGLLGADVEKVLNSSRVKGVAAGFQFEPTKKKSPLTVEQVLVLEKLTMFGQGQEAIFAGYICFLTHCRLRWSDGQHCIKEPTLDLHDGRGFIEAALYHHKTAFKRRTTVIRLLPVAGVIPGVSGCDWASCWLQKRFDMGLRASMQQPTMPAPMASGEWSGHPLSSSEASVWLREILQPWSLSPVKCIATHSAKATILSWMSKANVELSLRRLAGYHVTPGDKSALEYSRDAAAPVLRQIEAVFIAIRAGIFKPDLSRAKRWQGAQTLEDAVKLAAESSEISFGHDVNLVPAFSSSMCLESSSVNCDADQPGGEETAGSIGFEDDTTLETLRRFSLMKRDSKTTAVETDDISDMSDSPETDNSSVDRDSDSDDVTRRVELDGEKNASDLVAPSDLAGKCCFRHSKSQKLHFVGKTLFGVQYFKCGRKCNENYVKLNAVPAFSLHGCMTCFGWSDRPVGEDSDRED
jgi:hypothetical protein